MDDQEVELAQPDDKELFAAAVAPESPEAKTEKERDDLGRFVKAEKTEAPPEAKAEPVKAEQPAAEPPQEPKTADDNAPIPSWRMREMREERDAEKRRAEEALRERYTTQTEMQALREQLKKLQTPKQEPVDFFADPDKAIQQQLSPIEQRFNQLAQDMTLRMSRTSAIAQHGVESVAQMEKAIADAMAKNHPDMRSLAAQMRDSDDPAGVAMSWYQRQKLWDATGGDPDAYKAKVLEDALSDPKYLALAIERAQGQAGQNKTNPNIKLPPSLNRVPGAGGAPVGDDDVSDKALFQHATAGLRR